MAAALSWWLATDHVGHALVPVCLLASRPTRIIMPSTINHLSSVVDFSNFTIVSETPFRSLSLSAGFKRIVRNTGKEMQDLQCAVRINALCGEGPLWSPDEGVLYWIDCLRPAIYRFDPARDSNEALEIELPDQVFGLARRRKGGFLLVGSDGLSLVGPTGNERLRLGNPDLGVADTLANDGECDPQGRFWFGTGDPEERDPIGSLYRLDADLQFHRVDTEFVVTNGPAFSRDGMRMYLADSGRSRIYCYELDPISGQVSDRRDFAFLSESQGLPDGMTVDIEGCLLSAHFGGSRVTRYRPDGTIDGTIELPVPIVTSCAFGGSNLAILYITTGSVEFPVDWEAVRSMRQTAPLSGPVPGGLYRIDAGLKGFPIPAFAA